jgi:hypothetical protein
MPALASKPIVCSGGGLSGRLRGGHEKTVSSPQQRSTMARAAVAGPVAARINSSASSKRWTTRRPNDWPRRNGRAYACRSSGRRTSGPLHRREERGAMYPNVVVTPTTLNWPLRAGRSAIPAGLSAGTSTSLTARTSSTRPTRHRPRRGVWRVSRRGPSGCCVVCNVFGTNRAKALQWPSAGGDPRCSALPIRLRSIQGNLQCD